MNDYHEWSVTNCRTCKSWCTQLMIAVTLPYLNVITEKRHLTLPTLQLTASQQTTDWKEEWKNDQNQLEGIRGNRFMIWEEYFDACWLLSKMFLKRFIRIDTGIWLNDNWAGWMVYLYSVCILDLTDFLSSFQYRWNALIPCSIPRVYSLVRNTFQIETFFPDRLKGCWAFYILI